MALKRKTGKTGKIRKIRKIRKTIKTIKTRKTKRRPNHKRNTRRRVISGGNYERDVITRTTYGIPTKAANKFVVSVPGRGTMSGAAFLKLKEDLDRNGDEFYA